MILNNTNDCNDDTMEEDSVEFSSYEENGPCSIIVVNLPHFVFDDLSERASFESFLEEIDESVTFNYIKSFNRVKVNFASHDNAAEARRRIHSMEYKGQILRCFYSQPIIIGKCSHLHPPKREKQFLISPPASPPVGWEPIEEAEPLINYDLLSAVASLQPGEVHELHPSTEDKPGIFVHICENDSSSGGGSRIPQTRLPPRNP